MPRPKETDLYPPVKAFLEALGYDVKGEVGAADVMACRDADEPVLVELKTKFSLALVLQGIERQKVSDSVYIAVPGPKKRNTRNHVGLCRRLGLGLMLVRLRDGFVEVLCDPGPYAPRKSKQRKSRLLREFQRREGDPNRGGQTRVGLVTAYRQDALKCAAHLAEHGPTKGAAVARATGVPTATRIMAADHYGWFERVETGIYQVTPKGRDGLASFT